MADRNQQTTCSAGPWYSEGLRFECQPDCGACCSNHEGYAYVYLEGEDLSRLAVHRKMSIPEFRRRYTVLDEGYTVLRMDQPACPFLEGSRCGVYEARPKQCRSFPFWPENLASEGKWRRLSSFCPGVDRGETQSLKVIRTGLGLHESE